MAQHAILRFEKHKGNPARPLEAHHERQKEQYASNPDIDTSRSKYNFHIVKPESRYYHFIQSRIEQAGCRTRKDSTRFVDTLVTASPEFFKRKSPKEIQAFFQRAADFLIDRVGRENIVSAVVHMDEKTPHLHLTFVPLTKDNRLCAKEIIGNRANLTKWQDDFQLPGEIPHLWEPLFQHGEGFLFFLSGIQRKRKSWKQGQKPASKAR